MDKKSRKILFLTLINSIIAVPTALVFVSANTSKVKKRIIKSFETNNHKQIMLKKGSSRNLDIFNSRNPVLEKTNNLSKIRKQRLEGLREDEEISNLVRELNKVTNDLINSSLETKLEKYSLAHSSFLDFLNKTLSFDSMKKIILPFKVSENKKNKFIELYNSSKLVFDAIEAFRKYFISNFDQDFNSFIEVFNKIDDANYKFAVSQKWYEFELFKYDQYHYGDNEQQKFTADLIKPVDVKLTDFDWDNPSEYKKIIEQSTKNSPAYNYLYSLWFIENQKKYNLDKEDIQNVVKTLNVLYKYAKLKKDLYNVKPFSEKVTLEPKIAQAYRDAAKVLMLFFHKIKKPEIAKSVKDALNFFYTNPKRISGSYYEQGVLRNNSANVPYFKLIKGGEGNFIPSRSINKNNEGWKQIEKAIKNVIQFEYLIYFNDYAKKLLSNLAAITELAYYEEAIVQRPNLGSFPISEWEKYNDLLGKMEKNLETGFKLIPRFQQDNKTEEEDFSPITGGAKKIIINKINYLRYLIGYFFIKSNLIPEINIYSEKKDPDAADKDWWNSKLKTFEKQGYSSAKYRSLPEDIKMEVNKNLEEIYSTLWRLNNHDVNPNSIDSLSAYEPRGSIANSLTTIIKKIPEFFDLSPLKNLNSELNKVLNLSIKEDKTITAKLLSSIFIQTSDMLKIQNGENFDNKSFGGLIDLSKKTPTNFYGKSDLNAFSNQDLNNQLKKLQNALEIYELVKSLEAFQDQYNKVGVDGFKNAIPSNLKGKICIDKYEQWENNDLAVTNLLNNGIIPGIEINLSSIIKLVNSKFDLSNRSENNDIEIPGMELVSNYKNIKNALETLKINLMSSARTIKRDSKDVISAEIEIQKGDEKSQQINKLLDKKLNFIYTDEEIELDNSFTSLAEEIDKINPKNDVDKAVKIGLKRKLEKIKNEIIVKQMIHQIVGNLNEIDLLKIEAISKNSYGAHTGVINHLKKRFKFKEELKFFISLNYNDEKVKIKFRNLKSKLNEISEKAFRLAKLRTRSVSKLGAKISKLESDNNLFVNAMLDLYEGIKTINDEKLNSSKQNFYKWLSSSKKTDDKEFKKLYEILNNWSSLIKKAKEGDKNSIKELHNVKMKFQELKQIPNLYKTELEEQINSFQNVQTSINGQRIAGIIIGSFLILTIIGLAIFYKFKGKALLEKSKKNKNKT